MEQVKEWGSRVKGAIETAVYGKGMIIDLLLTAVLSGGHILLEDIPGLGKTILARALAAAIGGNYKRIQGTPDLMPADILGNIIYRRQEKKFHYVSGPLFGNIVLFDEINRATPRTQSALLEAMASQQVMVEGKPVPLPSPFILIGTENPIEFEGTFPLPEAQKDRFFLTASLGYPDRKSEEQILLSQNKTGHPVESITAVSSSEEINLLKEEIPKVSVSRYLEDLILDLIENLRDNPELELAPSPRAAQALYRGIQAKAALDGRKEATKGDLYPLVLPVLGKRILLTAEARMRRKTENGILEDLLSAHEG
jgi:MoxR-like ATPase